MGLGYNKNPQDIVLYSENKFSTTPARYEPILFKLGEVEGLKLKYYPYYNFRIVNNSV